MCGAWKKSYFLGNHHAFNAISCCVMNLVPNLWELTNDISRPVLDDTSNRLPYCSHYPQHSPQRSSFIFGNKLKWRRDLERCSNISHCHHVAKCFMGLAKWLHTLPCSIGSEVPTTKCDQLGKNIIQKLQENSAFTFWLPETLWWKMTPSIPYMITSIILTPLSSWKSLHTCEQPGCCYLFDFYFSLGS